MVVDDEQASAVGLGARRSWCCVPLRSATGAVAGRRISTRVPVAAARRSSMVAPIVAARDAHVGQALVAERAPSRRRVEAAAVVLDPQRRMPSVVGSSRRPSPRRARVAGDVAERLVDDAQQVRGARAGPARASWPAIASSTSIDRVVPELLDDRARGRRRASVPPRSSGRRPKMKLRMSRIVRWRLSIARSTRRSASSGSSCDELRHVLERQAHGVDALDDAVVEVLADPLALVDDRQPLDLLVEPGVLDRDAGVEGERLDQPLVVLRELARRRACR